MTAIELRTVDGINIATAGGQPAHPPKSMIANLINCFGNLPLGATMANLNDFLSNLSPEEVKWKFDGDPPLDATGIQFSIKVVVIYEYSLQSDKDLRASIPIVLLPYEEFDTQTDLKDCGSNRGSFVWKLSTTLVDWWHREQCPSNNARFVFDITVFATIGRGELPVLLLPVNYLKVEDVLLEASKEQGGFAH